MKRRQTLKYLTAWMVAFLSLTGCGQEASVGKTSELETQVQEVVWEELQEKTTNTTQEGTSAAEETSIFSVLDDYDFYNSSGVGAWFSYLTVDCEGNFSGDYRDADMGDAKESYPDGTVYICNFSGKFQNVTQENEYCYSMYVGDVQLANTPGTEQIEASQRICYVDGWGGQSGEKVYLYLPGMSIKEIPEDALIWLIDLQLKDDEILQNPVLCMTEEYRCFIGYTKNVPAAVEEESDYADYIYNEIHNPSWEYYCDESRINQEISQPAFQLVEKEIIPNNVTGAYADISELLPYADDDYSYSKWGTVENDYDSYVLSLYRYEDGTEINYDFSEFTYAPDSVPEDMEFVFQHITHAKVQDGILYVSISHNTYAQSAAHNAYLMAIDLETSKVIWKTQPLTCNSYNFDMIDDFLVCGYGFTSEDDYLKLVDKKTGKIALEMKVQTKPYYCIVEGNELRVKCYDVDYVFDIQR